jgi:hypothetical protein
MTKILIVDDGTESRMNKTRMYKMLAESCGADVTMGKLRDLAGVQGYDVVLTDLDGKSVADNQKFIDLVKAADPKPVVKMFSGYFLGGAADLPFVLESSGIISTHPDNEASKIIMGLVSQEKSGEIQR